MTLRSKIIRLAHDNPELRGHLLPLVAAKSAPDQHQLKILKDTVKNPLKGKFLGGPTAEEAEKILRDKFHFTERQIKKLKKASQGYALARTLAQLFMGDPAGAARRLASFDGASGFSTEPSEYNAMFEDVTKDFHKVIKRWFPDSA